MPLNEKKSLSTWSPLSNTFFRTLWIANVVSLVGIWMRDVAVSWLMTSLTPSAFMVAIVQTATMLPFFLLALPAGALADIVDRRRLLLFSQLWMSLTALALGITTILGFTTPMALLAFTFLLSIGAALNAPAWQAIIPELVHRDELPAAITLGSVGFNIARVLGPALGGFLVGSVGPGVTFLLNAASFSGVMAVLKRWRRETHESELPAERLMGAMRVGMRYVRNAPKVQAALIHAGVFSLFSSALWAFLPVLARSYVGLSAVGYGSLLGFFGAGGLLGATVLPRIKRAISMNVLALGITFSFALVFLTLSAVRYFPVLALAMCVGGAGWMVLLSALSTVVQAVTPAWVRGRIVSVYLLVFFGGLAGGGALWGAVAVWTGIPMAFVVAAGCLMVGGIASWPFALSEGEELDLRPSDGWGGATHVAEGLELEEKPVLVIVEYTITPEDALAFMKAVSALKSIRLRDGAIRWNLFHDISDPSSYVESFIVESWVEHLRQHERLTVSDKEIMDGVRVFHSGEQGIRARHFVLERVTEKKGGVMIAPGGRGPRSGKKSAG
jgi:MFS family permease